MSVMTDIPRRAKLVAVLVLSASSAAVAQTRFVLPAGSVILVRTTTALESATAKTGQTFESSVEESMGVDENTIIPAGTRIRGTVVSAKPATRQQSGVIDVVFDRLTFADGSTLAIDGKLTSTDSVERRQIKSNPNARVVLVGEQGGIGAAIAGAGSSKNSNSILAALGSLLSEGRDVSVPAGTPLAVELVSGVALRGRGRVRGGDAATIYTAAARVREAQQLLSQLRYYRGSANGVLDDATRRALFQFQVDKGLRGTGNLDGRTAQALGMDLATETAAVGLSADAASNIRRDAGSVLARFRADMGIPDAGRLDPSRSYVQSDLDLWFALSAFADNAALYEQLVRSGAHQEGSALAGPAFMNSARRVDTALQAARTTAQMQNAWATLRRQLLPIDTP